MRFGPAVVVAVSAIAVLSGCIGEEAAPEPLAPGIVAEADASRGGLEGVVTDDAFVPVPGAIVGILGREAETTTDEDGRFALSLLEPGAVEVAVTALGFEAAARTVTITADSVTRVDFQLRPLPTEAAYHTTQQADGRIFCGMALRPGLGGFAACGAVYDTPLSDLDSFVVPFELTAADVEDIRGIAFETEWQATQVFGKGLSVLWENWQEILAYTFTEPVRRFAAVQGESPLRAVVNDEDIRENVTEKDPPPEYCSPGGPCKIWARVFPYASTLGPQAPVDLAFYYDQRYTHYVTEFYGGYPPADFTMVPDA